MWKPERIFLVLAPVLGILYLIFTPPFQAPDEPNHFRRTYLLSSGQCSAERTNQRVGAVLPDNVAKVSDSFLYLRWNTHSKVSNERTRNGFIALHPDSARSFVDFPNTAQYTPLPYAPSAIGMVLGRIFGAPPLALMYLGRIFNLIFWIFLTWHAIRLMPVMRYTFMFLALLPMSMFIHSMISADVVTNALVLLSLSFLLHLIVVKKVLSHKDKILLLLLFTGLMLSKTVYTPVFLLFFAIPVSRFGSLKIYLMQLTLMGALGIGLLSGWYLSQRNIYVPATDYNNEYYDPSALGAGSNARVQWEKFQEDPGKIFSLTAGSLVSAQKNGFKTLLGEMGWTDVHFPREAHGLCWILLILLILVDTREHQKVPASVYFLIPPAILLSYVALIFSQHITWSSCSEDHGVWLQGRYLLPLIPVALPLFAFIRIPFKMPLGVIVLICILLLHAVTLYYLYTRYYRIPVFQDTLVYCDAERVDGDKLLSADGKHRLNRASLRTQELAFSGSHSLKIGGTENFGFTWRTDQLGMDDMLMCMVARNGNKGGLVFDSQGMGVYEIKDKPDKDLTNGWQRLFMKHTFEEGQKGSECAVYIFNPEPETANYDDFILLHKHVTGYK